MSHRLDGEEQMGNANMSAEGLSHRATPQEDPRPRSGRRWPIALTYAAWIAILIAISALPYIFFDGDFTRIVEQAMTEESSRIAAASIGIVLLVADLLLVIPSGLIIALMAALLGGVIGAIVGAIGLSLACALGFWIGRSIKGDFSDNPAEQRQFTYAKDLIRRNGVIILSACRPIPVLAELSVIAAGALGLPMRSVMMATVLANVGLASVYAGLGSMAGTGWLGFSFVLAASLALPATTILLARSFGIRAS